MSDDWLLWQVCIDEQKHKSSVEELTKESNNRHNLQLTSSCLVTNLMHNKNDYHSENLIENTDEVCDGVFGQLCNENIFKEIPAKWDLIWTIFDVWNVKAILLILLNAETLETTTWSSVVVIIDIHIVSVSIIFKLTAIGLIDFITVNWWENPDDPHLLCCQEEDSIKTEH